ncbi:MAG TPA: hypothetical protein VK753_10285 [Xanthomonadaceae bacterium]|nr:hypothetical protein [Xanthomonadaceae bacterium]
MIIEGTTQQHATGNGRQPAPAAAPGGPSWPHALHCDRGLAPFTGSTRLAPALAPRISGQVPGNFRESTPFSRNSGDIFTKIARLSPKFRDFLAEIARPRPKSTQILADIPRSSTQSPDIFRKITGFFVKTTQSFAKFPEMAVKTSHLAGPGRPPGNDPACPRPAIRMRPVRRGRLAARNPGSHPKVPPPGHRSAVFR